MFKEEIIKKAYAYTKLDDDNMFNDVIVEYHDPFNEEEFKILFKIVEVGNYELIKDLVSYDKNAFSFKNISNTDISKSLLEIDYGNKSEVFLSKYFGVEKNEAHYVRLFLDSINKVSNLPEDFRLKYESVLQLLNKVISASDEELIEFSKTMDFWC